MPDAEAINEVVCPACGGATPCTPVTAIHPETPELEALFKGVLNKVTCTHCDQEFLYQTPLVFRDDRNHYLVYYLPTSFVDGLDQALVRMREFYEAAFAELEEELRPECRLVLYRNQFIEKIALHIAGLDDRIVEYIKYQLFQHTKELDHRQHELLFDFGNSTEEKIRLLAYKHETGVAMYSMDVDTEDYGSLEEHFLADDEAAAQFDDLFRGFFVQVDTLLE